jgi:uncharacterized membrane protein
MFLSLPTSAWILIAVGSTVVNLVAMRWIIQVPTYRRLQLWMPVIGITCVGGRALTQSHSLGAALFLYTALMLGFPFMLAPVRNQITRDYYRWVQDPTTKTSKAAMTWIVISFTLVLVVVCTVWAVGTESRI